MKRLLTIILGLFILSSISVYAQNPDDAKYRRSSIYSLMIKHQNQQFANDISKVFDEMPVPDKYNSHDLSIKIISVDEKKVEDEDKAVKNFLERKHVASHLVAR